MIAPTFAEVTEIMTRLRDLQDKANATLSERFLISCLQHGAQSHAQLLQDIWVLTELNRKREGFFVEFGAADGRHASNSLMLESVFGWTGILAEPARVWHSRLAANRNGIVDHRCVWTTSGQTMIFNEPEIALHATLDAYSDLDTLADTRKDGNRYEVETVSLNDLLTQWKAPKTIDYLSIDTEGSELDILTAFDFDAWDVQLISVEHNFSDQRQPLHDLLISKGYQRRLAALSRVDDWYRKVPRTRRVFAIS